MFSDSQIKTSEPVVVILKGNLRIWKNVHKITKLDLFRKNPK